MMTPLAPRTPYIASPAGSFTTSMVAMSCGLIPVRLPPGVMVIRAADGSVSVRIRGTTSIRGSNEPLYVIDGVEIQPGPGGSLTGINPHDIATIEVVKDPAGEAMYGVRGANGVIIVKTKRPDQ